MLAILLIVQVYITVIIFYVLLLYTNILKEKRATKINLKCLEV
jgi:hypothetical protein